MKDEKAISIISLVVAIVVILILVGMLVYNSRESIDSAAKMERIEEMKNVEEIVASQRAKIIVNRFTPTKEFIITDAELDEIYGPVLSSNQITIIKTINASTELDDSSKYYRLTPGRMEIETENSMTVSNLKREYLVNYATNTIVLVEKEEAIILGEISDIDSSTLSPIVTVKFDPNGNINWDKIQKVRVTITMIEGRTLDEESLKYKWTQNVYPPQESEFVTAFTNGSEIIIKNETGNNWYLWILIKDTDGNMTITSSKEFYIDNTEPSGVLEVE